MNFERIIVNALEAGLGLETVVFALAAIGLNVHFGYTGLLNFGQSAFMAMAAYGLAVTVATYDLPMWLGIIVGLGLSVLLALLLGIPTLRLRADYLAIVTIAAAEIVRLTARSVTFEETLGGSDGRQAFSSDFYALNPYSEGEYGFGSFGFNERALWVLTVGWILVGLSCLVVFLLMRSPWGRVLKAIREDEDAVRSLGKNVYSYKMQSLVIGGVLGCLGGFILALGRSSIQPDIFGTETTFFAYTILILGGAARVASPVIGAMIFWVLLSLTDNILNEAINEGLISSSVINNTQVGQFRFMLVGLLLMVLMIFRPQGIFGDRREIALDAR
ncbi:MAG TPA: branched-chain amino acid ABC transporter permease, partial [Actinomycetes bacterium]